MSLEQFSGFLHRNPSLDDNQIATILTMWQQLNPPIDDTADQELDVIANPTRVRSTTVKTGPGDEIATPTRRRKTGMYRRRAPQQCTAFDPIITKTGTVSYPNPTGATAFSQIFGCLGIMNGTQWISFSDAPRLAAGSGKTAFACWVLNPGTGTYGLLCKRNIANTTNAGIEIWITGGNSINVRIADGTNTVLLTVSATLNDGNPHSIIINVPDAGNLEIFVDNVSKGTISRGSVGSITNTRTTYVLARDNAGTPQDLYSGSIALVQWKKGEIFSSGQRTDYHSNGVIDTSGSATVDCFLVPYAMSDDVEPDAYASLSFAHA